MELYREIANFPKSGKVGHFPGETSNAAPFPDYMLKLLKYMRIESERDFIFLYVAH